MNISISDPKIKKENLKYTTDNNSYHQAVISTATIPAPANWKNDTFEKLDKKHFKTAEKVIKEYKDRRDTLIDELHKIEGVKVTPPKAAFYCIAELPVDNTETFAQWLLESYHLNGETVMVAPAAGFYSTPGMGLKQVRIAYVLNKEDLTRAVHILKDAIATYNAR